MTSHLQIIGISLIALAAMHVFFPSRFRWREELSTLSLLNRQIFYVHTFFICLGLVLTGLLCFSQSAALLEVTAVNRTIHLFLGIFWLIRLIAQLFVYDRSHWLGKPLETFAHVTFSGFWSYLASVHLLAFRQVSV